MPEQTPKAKARALFQFAEALDRAIALAPTRKLEQSIEDATAEAWVEVLGAMQQAGLIDEDTDPYALDVRQLADLLAE